MSTIKDIAQLAGVSCGTVSNVLNGKSGVSLEKIRRVEEAVQKLGYKVDVRARSLRQKKRSSVAMIIPTLALQHYSDLYQSLKSCLKEEGVLLQLYLTDGFNDIERQSVEQIVSSNIDTIVSLSCLPSNDNTYDLVPEDVSIYFVGRKIRCSHRKAIFVTFEYEKAAEEIAAYVIGHGYKKAAYFADTKRYAERNSMYVMLSQLLGRADIALDFYTSDNPLMLGEAFEILGCGAGYDVIITSNVDRAQAVASVHHFVSSAPPPPIITLAVPKIIAPDTFVRYELNFKRMGREIARRILRNETAQRRNLSDIVLENDGLSYQPPQIRYHTGDADTLRMLIPESVTSRALEQVLPNFQKQLGCRVEIDAIPPDDLYEVIGTLSDSGVHDLVCMEAYWYPRYGRAVYAVPSDNERAAVTEIGGGLFDLFRSYGVGSPPLFCLPLDVSPQLLVYRKDLFENYIIRREYTELYGEPLAVPRTFREFGRAARFFTQKYTPASPTGFGAACDFETPFAAYCEFAPRLFSALAEDGSPLETAVTESLQQLFEVAQYTDKIHSGSGAFSRGNAALHITTSSGGVSLVDSKHSDVGGFLGYAAVPGGRPLILGKVIGASKHSARRPLALHFLRWLYSHEVTTALTFLGCLSPNPTVYQNTNIIALFPWLSNTKNWLRSDKHNALQMRLSGDRLPENSIGVTVRGALKKTISLEQATNHIAGILRDFAPATING